jgi:RNA polymerase sigma-70 factor (ECF subfamily)
MSEPAKDGRARLYVGHQRMLRAYLLALVRNGADADDLLQEVAVQILSAREPETDPARFGAWSRGVARNVVLHHWRSRQRSREAPSEQYLALVERAYAEADSVNEAWSTRHRALATCLERLGPGERELLALRYVEDLSSEVVAARTRRSPSGVRMALLRLRERLLRCVEQRLGEERLA